MATMQAIEISRPGAADVLQLTERPIPRPGPGQVLIKVAAAGVNRPDIFQRQGNYAPPPGASDLPGLEVAGEWVDGDVGSDNPFALKRGDAVCALLAGGGYAEYAVAPLLQCLPVPKGYSMIEAAALPENYFTVWSNVFNRGRLGTASLPFNWLAHSVTACSQLPELPRNAQPARSSVRTQSTTVSRISWRR